MEKRTLVGGMLAAVVLIAGCAVAAPRTGEVISVTGRLVLKGSMPMVRVVLLQDGVEQWDLQGVPAEALRTLQNRDVTVEGRVERARSSGMLPATLQVMRIAGAT